MQLKGEHINLRALEPEDLHFLFNLENDTALWHLSNTQTPFSKHILQQYIANAHQDIYEAKQLRLVIEHNTQAIGCIDLFDYSPQHRRAGIGIVIQSQYQEKGLASEALKMLINYAFSTLNLHQLYANIEERNSKSIALFAKHNFVKIGIKKDWNFFDGNYEDEGLYQLIKS